MDDGGCSRGERRWVQQKEEQLGGGAVEKIIKIYKLSVEQVSRESTMNTCPTTNCPPPPLFNNIAKINKNTHIIITSSRDKRRGRARNMIER